MELAIPLISPAVQIIEDNLKINSVTGASTTFRKRDQKPLVTVVSGNSRHFFIVLVGRLELVLVLWLIVCADVNWFKSSMVWHTDSHLASSFTSMRMASCRTYFMKALYHWLLVAVHKHLYDRKYPSVVCLFCGDVEISDYVFLCPQDAAGCARLLDTHASTWKALSGLFRSSSCVLWVLASCISEVGIGVALCKGFVFDDWFQESVLVFKDSKEDTKRIVGFVHEFCLAFWDDIWLVRAKYWAFMERHGLIPHNGSIPMSISGLPVAFSAGVIRLLDIAEAFGISFKFCKLCLFFSGIGDTVSVHIGM
ncbi:hypothetical protein G9A89_012419 [Geosiphon pyriformis]|nr:hypothetical protein G9A89_012419 [Geosiphon pyriformis]